GKAVAVPKRRLCWHLQGTRRASRDHPLPRPTPPRIFAARSRIAEPFGGENGHQSREDCSTREGTARVQPHAWLPRLPAGTGPSRNFGDASPRSVRGRGRSAKARYQSETGDYDPAGRLQEGVGPSGRT